MLGGTPLSRKQAQESTEAVPNNEDAEDEEEFDDDEDEFVDD